MSRIGKKPIPIPGGAKISVDKSRVSVQGPLGGLEQQIPYEISVEIKDNQVFVMRKSESKRDKSLHGLSRTLIANMLHGVTKGFKKELKIVGVGYRAELKGKRIVFSLGFSHPIVLAVPDGIRIDVNGPDAIVIHGHDRQLVGDIAAKIRSFRPPEPYKGKGIHYLGEQIRRKAGKAAV